VDGSFQASRSSSYQQIMKVTLRRTGDAFHFVGTNEAGRTIEMDTSAEHGGTGQAPSPMQVVAMALGGCSAIDVIDILRKARQRLDSLEIEIDAERAQDQTPAVFTRLHCHFLLSGELEPAKVERALDLSFEKYCSVSKMLEKTATIDYSYSINGVRYART
jgi:putative redox protein